MEGKSSYIVLTSHFNHEDPNFMTQAKQAAIFAYLHCLWWCVFDAA